MGLASSSDAEGQGRRPRLGHVCAESRAHAAAKSQRNKLQKQQDRLPEKMSGLCCANGGRIAADSLNHGFSVILPEQSVPMCLLVSLREPLLLP